MKKTLLTLAIALSGTMLAIAQQAGAVLNFEKMEHDYGMVEQGGNGECEFVFTNTGTEPLVIAKAKGSCGCTVPEWPKEPIAPGAKGSIKVKYDTKRVGPINKSVTIESNATEPVTTLKIKGTVKAAPTEDGMPAMKSVEGATPVEKN